MTSTISAGRCKSAWGLNVFIAVATPARGCRARVLLVNRRGIPTQIGEPSRAAEAFGDDRLHRLIAEAAQNPLLLMLHDAVQGYARELISERMEQALGHSPAPVETSNGEHAAIVAAIKRHDPEGAENAIRKHLASIRNLLFGDR